MSSIVTEPRWIAPPSLLKLLASLLICFAAAAFGSWMTIPNIAGWYTSLAKVQLGRSSTP
jgi:hypothetical protein